MVVVGGCLRIRKERPVILVDDASFQLLIESQGKSRVGWMMVEGKSQEKERRHNSRVQMPEKTKTDGAFLSMSGRRR